MLSIFKLYKKSFNQYGDIFNKEIIILPKIFFY